MTGNGRYEVIKRMLKTPPTPRKQKADAKTIAKSADQRSDELKLGKITKAKPIPVLSRQ